MLQRVYYTDDPIEQIIADAKAADERDRLRRVASPALARASAPRAIHRRRGPCCAVAETPAGSEEAGMYATRRSQADRPALPVARAPVRGRVHGLSVPPDDLGVVPQLDADRAAKFNGLANFTKAFNDRQFWVSLRYTLWYTLLITPILMIGGYVMALLLSARNSPIRRITRAVVFLPVVIGLGASSFLWYWLFSPAYGLIDKLLHGHRAHR